MVERNGDYSEGGGDGSGGGETLGGTFDEHTLYYEYQSSGAIGSQGGGSIDWARNTTNSIVDHSIAAPDDGGGSGSGDPGGGLGDPGAGSGSAPSYELETGETTTLSNSGSTSLNANSSYGINVNSPSYEMNFIETYTGLSGVDGDLVETISESHLTSDNTGSSDGVTVVDNTTTKTEWQADGLHLIKDGTSTVTSTTSNTLSNHGLIREYQKYDDGNGTIRHVEYSVLPDQYQVAYNNTDTNTTTFEDFGYRLTFGLDEGTGDQLELAGGPMIVNTGADGTGKRTVSGNSTGNESLTHNSKYREDLVTPFGGGYEEQRVNLTGNGNWNFTDTLVNDFAADGTHTTTFTPSGTRTATDTVHTEGDHQYNFTLPDDGGYELTIDQSGDYTSDATLGSTTTRSGGYTIVVNPDQTLASATGSVVLVQDLTGDASAHDNSEVTKVKSKAITTGSGSGSGGSGSGSAGGTTGGTSGPSVVGSTESLTAYRNLTRDSADRYHSVITETSSVSVGVGGELATDENVTYTNDVSGELSRDDRSYVKKDIIDDYSDGTTQTSTEYIKADETITFTDSYDPDLLVGDGTSADIGFYNGKYFGSLGYQGQIIDTSFNSANVSFGGASGGLGVEGTPGSGPSVGDEGTGLGDSSGDGSSDRNWGQYSGNGLVSAPSPEDVGVDMRAKYWESVNLRVQMAFDPDYQITASQWGTIAGQAVLQTGANAINGLQDGFVAIANIPKLLLNTGSMLFAGEDHKYIEYWESPDWSRNLFSSDMSDTMHEISKFAGGAAASIPLSGGVGAVGKLAQGTRAVQTLAKGARFVGLNGKASRFSAAVGSGISKTGKYAKNVVNRLKDKSKGTQFAKGADDHLGRTPKNGAAANAADETAEIAASTTSDDVYNAVNELNNAPKSALPVLDDGLNFLKNGGCFVPETPVIVPATANCHGYTNQENGSTAATALSTAEIAKISLGSRVIGENPNPWDLDYRFDEPSQSEWVQIEASVERDDGSLVELEVLRPKTWATENGLFSGSVVKLRLSELQVDGYATINRVTAAPAIEHGPGQVVTGRFITRNVTNLIELKFSDGTSVRTTSVHPFWSESRQDWIEADDLFEGETVNSLNGPHQLQQIVRIGYHPAVYNLEVHTHHVYRVAQVGILVHNECFVGEKARQLIAESVDDALIGVVDDAGKVTLFRSGPPGSGLPSGHSDLVARGLVGEGSQGFSLVVRDGKVTHFLRNSVLNSGDFNLPKSLTDEILEQIPKIADVFVSGN